MAVKFYVRTSFVVRVSQFSYQSHPQGFADALARRDAGNVT